MKQKLFLLSVFLLTLMGTAQVTVSTLAGSTSGFADGTGAAAKFNTPVGVATDAAGNVYVADQANNRIRKITPAGVVSTFAGSTAGFADGTGAAAKFNTPNAVATDAAGNVYVADTGNQKIRKITPAGVVSTFAGSTAGFADGTGAAVKFKNPYGVATDATGNVYVADYLNNKIRKITPAGEVSTLAGSTSGFADGTGAVAQFNSPIGVATDAAGNVYVADVYNYKIRKITPVGEVSTLAGSTSGFANGTGTAAQFNSPRGVATDAAGNVYVADYGNNKIRKITPAGEVSTFAGSGANGTTEGPVATAKFSGPQAVATDAAGNVYVADQVNNRIRKITIAIAPAAPNANDQSFCNTATVANLVATGTGLLWYNLSTGGTALASSTALTTGTYYVSQTVGSVESARTSVAVTVNASTLPSFTQVAPIFAGGNLMALPTTSNNGVTGTWSPALNNAATTTYTFTPTTGQCASTTTMTITVNAIPTPLFTQVGPFCAGASLAALPTVSNNSITGTWSPAINNLATTTYTFTPTAGQNATSTTMTIVVNASTTPTFNALAPICSGASLSALPTTSTNSISGTWSPALNNTQTTDYTFTPNGGVCASTAMLTITVYPITAAPTASAQSFCNSATVSQLTATGSQLKWYAVASNGSSLAGNTAVATGTYYVSQTLNGCESARTPVAVTVITTPALASQAYYVDRGIPLSSVPGYGNSYQIYATANAASALPISTVLSSGTYYGTNTQNGCESTRSLVTVVIYVLPSIASPTCGSRMTSISEAISATAVANANSYLFEVTGNGTTRTYYSSTNSFNFTQLSGSTAYDTAYSIRVSAGFSGQFGNFGPVCYLTTPASATNPQIMTSQCGATLASLTTPIYCAQIVGAQAYRFEFTDGGVARTMDSVTNNVQISNLTGGATYNTAYSVRVAAKIAGVWQDFGYPCTVTTPAPSTQIRTNQCGTTLTTKWTILNCGAITGATSYRFEWTNGGTVLTYTTTSASMQLGNFTGWAVNTTYSVRVAVEFGGTWQAYGPACTVKSPAVARMIAAEATALTIKAVPNPYETEYVLMAQGGNQTPIQVSVYDMLGKQVEQFTVEANELENRSLGTNYTSGIYNVMISQGDDQQVVRIIKK
jgi:sugar lactone lactonase YvrE